MEINENTEIRKWEERAFYPNLRFKEKTKADLKKLDEMIKKSNDSFVVIGSSSESSVYKICRYMIEKGFLKNKDLTFEEGRIFEAYIDITSRFDYKIRELIDDLCISLKNKVNKKWLVIPYIETEWTPKSAMYFITQIERMNCYGIIFYSPTQLSGNLMQTLFEGSSSRNMLQFPEEVYKRDLKEDLEDDGF